MEKDSCKIVICTAIKIAIHCLYLGIFKLWEMYKFLDYFSGHFVAPALAHAFCNHMGFPAFNEVLAYDCKATRRKLIAAFVIGLLVWLYLLLPLTTPFLYSNDVYDCYII